MPAIPDSKDLMEEARPTQRPIENREWKRYQRYLRKLMQQRANAKNKQTLKYEKFFDVQQNQEK